MTLSDQLTLSIVSHGHGPLVETLVAQLDTIEALAGVKVILTLNVPGEPFLYEIQPLHRLRLDIVRNASPLGFGANHNQAFKKCETHWYAILNPDLSLPTDVFTPLLQTARAENAALVAPCVVNPEGITEDSVRWNLTPWSLFMRRLGVQGESSVGDHKFRWFAGMFYIVSSTAFRQIGGFDTRYFLYCEDYDLCARMHLANHKLRYEPGFRVIHDARRASWKSSRYLVMHMKSLLRVWCSNPVWRIALKNM
ncbi:glycosyltransferase, partial [Roseateles oligotrophus]